MNTPGNPTAADFDFSKHLLELEIHMSNLAKTVEKLEEAQSGTLRTRGMRDRILLAEENIEANKKSFEKLDRHIVELEANLKKTLQEAFIEVTNDFTQKLQGVVTDNQAQKAFVSKWQPYLNVLAWLVTGAGGILLMLFMTGQLSLIRP